MTLRNRIVVPPMWQYCGRSGRPTDWHLMNLGRFAAGGAGLVFQEGTAVERRGCGTASDIGIWDDAAIEPLSRIAAFVEAQGARCGIQLMHAGRKARQRSPMEGRGPMPRSDEIPDWDAWTPIAPSALAASEGFDVPEQMSLADIAAVQAAFVAAARRADRAGYSAINLHGGHGYLLHQFLSETSNRREDRYGGSYENRVRMLLETIEGVRSVWPDGKPLFLRLSCVDGAGWTLEDTVRLVPQAHALGVDVIDCSSGGIEGSATDGRIQLQYGYQVELAREVRRRTGVATSAVGLIVHADQAEQVLRDRSADLVGIGREFLLNPNWAHDAALKLGEPDWLAQAPRVARHFLGRRALSAPGVQPSTLSRGLHDTSSH